jgi:hypothetical protein
VDHSVAQAGDAGTARESDKGHLKRDGDALRTARMTQKQGADRGRNDRGVSSETVTVWWRNYSSKSSVVQSLGGGRARRRYV